MLNKKNSGYAALLASLIWLIHPAANAQSDSEILESVRACQNVSVLSARLTCYDRILPPTVQVISNDDSLATREELEKTVASLESQLDIDRAAQIVEVQEISLTSTRLLAADGRIFVRTKAESIVNWPAAPFNIEIVTARMGTKYIVLPGRRDRIRIKIE